MTVVACSHLCPEAVTFLTERLRRTVRPSCGQSPLEHALEVAAVVHRELGVEDVPTLTIALLHDVLEDGEVTVHELREQFGAEIANSVALLTKPSMKTKKDKALYLRQICMANDRVKLVKIADLLHNLRRRRGTDREASTRRGIRKFLESLAIAPQSESVRNAARVLGSASGLRVV